MKQSVFSFWDIFSENRGSFELLELQIASISYRETNLFNILRQNSLIPKIFVQVSNSDIQRIAHEVRDLFILSNKELIKFVFDDIFLDAKIMPENDRCEVLAVSSFF